jgi:AcrR family transcriptional regulator
VTSQHSERAHAIVDDLIHALHDSREQILQAIATVPEADFGVIRTTSQWSLLDMLGHLESWEAAWTDGLAEIAAGLRPKVADFDLSTLDDWNAAAVAARRGQSVEASLANWEKTRWRLLAVVQQIPPERWVEKGSLARHLTRACLLHPLKHLDLHIRPALERYAALPADTVIADAAYSEFLTRGYDDARPEAVARQLGVAWTVFLGRFATKYDLWYMALCESAEKLVTTIETRAAAEEPEQRLREACRAYVEFGLSNPRAYRLLYMPRSSAMQDPEAPAPGVISGRALMQRLIKRCIKEGIFHTEQPAELVTQGLWCALHGVTEFHLNIRRIPWAEGLQDHVIETHLAGLRAGGAAGR